MIKKIIKCLKENNQVTDWLIEENVCNTSEAFYVLQHLETTRVSITTEYKVTIYHKFNENNRDYLGSSSFLITHKLSNQAINKQIMMLFMQQDLSRMSTTKLLKEQKKEVGKKKQSQHLPLLYLIKLQMPFLKKQMNK